MTKEFDAEFSNVNIEDKACEERKVDSEFSEFEFLKEQLELAKIKADSIQIKTLIAYMDHILEWNENINLTAITDRKDFIIKHIVDSLLISNLPEFKKAKTVLDVGTGGGFPGIPLAIIHEDKEFLLVDSLRKRINVIDEGVEILGIENVRLLHSRAEDLINDSGCKKGFSVVVSRAVANMTKLAGYMLPYVKKGGVAIALKGPSAADELEKAESTIKKLGGRKSKIVEIPSNDYNHCVIIIEK